MSLYDLQRDIATFEFEIDEETGEITNFDKLDQLELERETKIENIGLYIKNLLAESEMIKQEIDSLNERKKAKENKAQRLKDYLANNLNGEKFETSKLKISYRKSEKVECTDIELVDDDYITLKFTKELNKKAVKEAIKNGEIVKGCELIENSNIQIK